MLRLPLLAAALWAGEPSLQDLVDASNKALRGDSSHGRLTMTIVNPKWKRTLELEGWNRGRQMAFILIHAPAKEKGNTTLRRINEMWVWMPRVERVIKIPPNLMHNSWQGSDFTYEDIVKADSVVKDYTHELIEKKQEKERVLWRVKGSPKPDAPVVWGRVELTIAQYPDGQVVPLEEKDYNERGELIRTITLSGVKSMGGRLVPSKLECVPAKKPGQSTTLEYHALEFDIPLEDSFFSLARLQKGVK